MNSSTQSSFINSATALFNISKNESRFEHIKNLCIYKQAHSISVFVYGKRENPENVLLSYCFADRTKRAKPQIRKRYIKRFNTLFTQIR